MNDRHHNSELLEFIINIDVNLGHFLNLTSNFSNGIVLEKPGYHIVVNKKTGDITDFILSLGYFHIINITVLINEYFKNLNSLQIDLCSYSFIKANGQKYPITFYDIKDNFWSLEWNLDNINIKWIHNKHENILSFSKKGIAKNGFIFGIQGINSLDEISIHSQKCIVVSFSKTNEECYFANKKNICIPTKLV